MHPERSQSVFLLSADKDVLTGALKAASEGRERDSILSALSRSGTSDTNVALTPTQAEYLRTNLVGLMDSAALKGTKYDTGVARDVAQSIVERLSSAA